jgi:hypothetical protein
VWKRYRKGEGKAVSGYRQGFIEVTKWEQKEGKLSKY